jgi:BirA family biotin operon repressor/biotin-[acetyl-CoA-carboxylase] ligase
MDHEQLQQALKDLPLGAIRFYKSISSTNREAMKWAEKDAPDMAIVIADEQTSGYGRRGRRWYTPRGTGLAFSLILKPPFSKSKPAHSGQPESSLLPRLTALGTLAVTETLRQKYDLETKIKWPNDVLVNGYKLAGVLVEALWFGQILTAAVIGIGINVRDGSVPEGIDLDTPANCVENFAGEPVARAILMGQILENLLFWRSQLFTDRFLEKWEKGLAHLGEWTTFKREGNNGQEDSFQAKLLGLEPDGSLRIRTHEGSTTILNEGTFRINSGGYLD